MKKKINLLKLSEGEASAVKAGKVDYDIVHTFHLDCICACRYSAGGSSAFSSGNSCSKSEISN